MSNYCSLLEGYEYGRGAGYVSRSICNRHSDNGCDKNGYLFYPKCRNGYDAVGCCICSNDNLLKRFKEIACPVAYNAFNLAGGCKYSTPATIAAVSACMTEGGGPEDVLFDAPCVDLVQEISGLCNSEYQLTQQIACQNYNGSPDNFGTCPFFPKIRKTDQAGTNCPTLPECTKTKFGCCPNKFTPKDDEIGSNCPSPCIYAKYGCCDDQRTIKLDDKGSNCPKTCLLKYTQCSGKNLKCCDDSVCRAKDDYYSQCCPKDKTSDECQSWPVDNKPTFTPNCTPKYGNCTNPVTKCCEDSECRKKDLFYSQCCPKNKTGDECQTWNLR